MTTGSRHVPTEAEGSTWLTLLNPLSALLESLIIAGTVIAKDNKELIEAIKREKPSTTRCLFVSSSTNAGIEPSEDFEFEINLKICCKNIDLKGPWCPM